MLLFALTLAAATPPGDPRCASPRTADLNACAGADWMRADAAMNAQYRATMAQMKASDAHPQPDATTGPTYAAALLASQRAWLAFRDAECVSEGYRNRGGSMEEMVILGCKADLTRARTGQLHALTVTP
ncbi:lysozyme inhibitor LprI family protein [Sphingomonas sp. CROZ-RG-20F-R02-07]|uniref:lysozyme inhibitor LprI family protein n=1 Tax=Sphingomonas sp. CROZ-RG-20F-R02-07 TaxID=2914832 RepID=UPI001F58AE97|nr:lysozyme inhibitor LprI family protein [Sphingomonas sp. CROZ-RG-20F-R02-07]